MYPKRIVVIAEFVQLTIQVDGVPEEHAIKIFSANRADQPFDERMRDRDVGNRFDLIDFEYPKVGEPPMKAKEWVMIGADVFR